MIKRLAACIRQYKRDAILTPIYVTLEVVFEVIIPILMARLIDYGIDEGNMSYILKMGGALVAAAAVALFFGVLAGSRAAAASAGFAANIRADMYHNVQEYSFSNIDKFSPASIVTRMTTDVTNVQNAYQMLIRVGFRAPAMLFFSLFMSYKISPELSLIFLVFVPILAIGLYVVFRIVHPVFQRVFKTYDKLNNVIQENLHAIRVVKSFVREDFEDQKFDAISQSIYHDFTWAEKALAFNAPLMQFSMYGCLVLISWFGAHLIVASGNNPAVGMTTGQLMSLFTYVTQILMSLMMVSMVFVMITISRASGERIVEILTEESDIVNRPEPVRTVKDGSIKFEDVSFRYAKGKGKLSLENVNLDIKSGQTIGIIGGTGSSKTTLVQLIPRLYDVTEGRILVGGVDTRDYDIETLRDKVAMVLQKNVLFSGTIKENLRWGDPHATDEELAKACRLAQADEFVRSFPQGYDTYVEQGGTNLSGGQKQRLCIARALLKKPQILILDDSTSAVDTKTDALIRRAMSEEIPHTTKIIIAQRVASVQDADQIIVMEGGHISGVGTHADLLRTNEIYREVYESQTKAGVVNE